MQSTTNNTISCDQLLELYKQGVDLTGFLLVAGPTGQNLPRFYQKPNGNLDEWQGFKNVAGSGKTEGGKNGILAVLELSIPSFAETSTYVVYRQKGDQRVCKTNIAQIVGIHKTYP